MSEENKIVLRRLLTEAFGHGNLAAVDTFVADDFVDHSPPPEISADKAGMKQMVQMFRTAFPDMKLTIEDMIAEGDKVAVRIVTSGTHTGDLMGIAPTGKTAQINEQHWVRVTNGKITDHWGVEDNLGMMQQLGIIKAP